MNDLFVQIASLTVAEYKHLRKGIKVLTRYGMNIMDATTMVLGSIHERRGNRNIHPNRR